MDKPLHLTALPVHQLRQLSHARDSRNIPDGAALLILATCAPVLSDQLTSLDLQTNIGLTLTDTTLSVSAPFSITLPARSVAGGCSASRFRTTVIAPRQLGGIRQGPPMKAA